MADVHTPEGNEPACKLERAALAGDRASYGGGATVALALATCRKVGELPVRARAWARRGGGGGRGLFCQHRECLPKVHVMAHGAHKQELKSSTRPRQRCCAVSGS